MLEFNDIQHIVLTRAPALTGRYEFLSFRSPGGGRAWDWNETGTRHVPGIQPADVLELLDRGSQVVVLTRGMQLVLRTCPETLALLHERGIPVHVEETRAAVALYNQLAADTPVGGLRVAAPLQEQAQNGLVARVGRVCHSVGLRGGAAL